MRTILLTGANGGIGIATAIDLARRDLRVLASVRSEAKGEEVLRAAHDAGVGGAVDTVVFDVTDAEATAAAIDGVPLYGLVNNAGYTNLGTIEDVTDDEARRQIETMLLSPLRLARAALPGMKARGEGRIVNVSSIFAFVSTPLNGWYQASKHGLDAATNALRAEVARSGVSVISIQPGAVRTGLWSEYRDRVEQHRGSPYESAYVRSQRFIDLYGPVMSSPEQVAACVGRALTSSRPRSTYLVGVDAHVLAVVARVLPRPVQDALTKTVLGL